MAERLPKLWYQTQKYQKVSRSTRFALPATGGGRRGEGGVARELLTAVGMENITWKITDLRGTVYANSKP